MTLVPLSIPGPGLLPMQITELSPTRFDLPGRADPVYIATHQWALEPWEGEDPPELGRSWAIKPKFVVNGNGRAPNWPSCITGGTRGGMASGCAPMVPVS